MTHSASPLEQTNIGLKTKLTATACGFAVLIFCQEAQANTSFDTIVIGGENLPQVELKKPSKSQDFNLTAPYQAKELAPVTLKQPLKTPAKPFAPIKVAQNTVDIDPTKINRKPPTAQRPDNQAVNLKAPTAQPPLIDTSNAAPLIETVKEVEEVIQPPEQAESAKTPIDLSADNMSHDDINKTVTAQGNVEIRSGDEILYADKVVYYLAEDRVVATGNVTIQDRERNIHQTKYAELQDKLKDGFVDGLMTKLQDGSRITAVNAKRQNGSVMEMKEVTYSPCKPCAENPEKAPLWQIRAKEVSHDQETGDIDYKKARFEFFGVPIAYTPVFKHKSDGRPQSGFLRPSAAWTTELGAYVDVSYYFNIAANKDLTLNVQPTTKQGVLSKAHYRHQFEKGELDLRTSLALGSDRTEDDGRVETDVTRGHIFAKGQYHINQKWRAGFDIERSTDDQYLRLYDISNENVLESEAYVERFVGRNYSKISGYNFQDVRIGLRPTQPDVIPYVEHEIIGAPNSLFGGRAKASFSSVGLYRDNGDQDVMRNAIDLSWQRQAVSAFGLKSVFNTSLRQDVYYIEDSDLSKGAPPGDKSYWDDRFLPQAQVISSYPMYKNTQKAQWLIEPMAALTVAPQVDNDQNEIPNEDSIDVQLDTSNLFDINRFPGSDRQEDGTRIAYGLKSGFYDYKGRSASIFLGQAYRFGDDSVFSRGTGLDDNQSDIVGQVMADWHNDFQVSYMFQLDHQKLESQRHELIANARLGTLNLNTNYLYIAPTASSGFTETREQIAFGGAMPLNDRWKFSIDTTTDLGQEPGLRKASSGLHYADDCFKFSLLGVRNLVNSTSGENETTLFMRIGLKNLGEIETPQILLDSEKPE